MGLNTSCSISFMIVGHTKFGPDWFFGLLKNKYRKPRVSSMSQIASVVKNSTVDDQNEVFLVGQDEPPLFDHDWHNTSLHSSLPYLTSPATIISPITLTIQAQYCDSPPTTFNFLKSSPPKDALPPILHPEGLSNTRQEYFYDEIRQFCEDECKDIASPQSSKRGVACSVSNTDICKPAKRQRTCSHCKQPGHTKTKKGVITSPQLAS